MNLTHSTAQAALCLALVVPPFVHQGAAQDLPRSVASSQSWLGIGIIDLAPERARQLGLEDTYGVEVAQVAPNGPAAEAGIQPGDVITRFGTEKVRGAEHVARLVRETPAGRTVSLEAWSNGKRQEVDVVVKQRGGRLSMDRDKWPQSITRGLGFDVSRPVGVVHNRTLGVEVEPLKGQLAEFFGVESGVLVRSVDEDSPAAAAGISAGDVIVAVGAGTIRYPADVRREMLRAEAPIKVSVVRSKRKRTVTLPQTELSDNPWPLSRHPESR
jgi:serine protease Do